MFSGTQISPYPITDDFVDVILGAISALDAYKATSRIETDDMLTLLVGPPDQLFPAMRDCSFERRTRTSLRPRGHRFSRLRGRTERSYLHAGWRHRSP